MTKKERQSERKRERNMHIQSKNVYFLDQMKKKHSFDRNHYEFIDVVFTLAADPDLGVLARSRV